MSRRWRNLLARRGRFWPVAPAPVVAAPPRPPGFVEQSGSRPRWARPRRGVFVAVPPAPVQQQVALAPSFRGARARLVTPIRRGQFLPLLSHRPIVPRAVLTRRLRSLVPARRGVFFAVPAAPTTAAGPGPLVMAAVRGSSRRTLPPARRGRFEQVPLVGQLSLPGPLAPSLRRQSPRPPVLPFRRGEFVVPPWPQQIAVTPPPPSMGRPASSRRPGPVVLRRGSSFRIVPVVAPGAPTAPPTWTGTRRPRPAAARRGRFVPFPPLPPAGPGPLVLPLRRRERARLLVPPRGAFATPTPDPVLYVPPAEGSMRAATRRGPDMAAARRGGPTARKG